MTSEQTATNPLTDFPVVGGVVQAADSLLRDLNIPLWLAQVVELAGLLLLLHVLLTQVFRRVLPWLAPLLDEALAWTFDRIAMLLLVPELVSTRIRTRKGKPPLSTAYTYGDSVVSLANAAKSVAHVVLDVLPRMRTAPPLVPAMLVFVIALVWNSETCTGDPCVSPATQWFTVAGEWFGQLV
ncbi:hypothetical protein [Kibdelosporangium aridum]|nr:hypothetical protein [Kibdelosporangium aridum]